MKMCSDNHLEQITSKPASAALRGFTLIELLVVILIIGVVISIVVPTLGKARRTARITATKQLTTNVVNAASTFESDTRRWPGKFSPRDMGGAENLSFGMSGMENAMLDLAGGIVQEGGRGNATLTRVAPFNPLLRLTEVVYVDTALIGNTSVGNTTNKGYFVPPAKNFVAQINTASELKQAGSLSDGTGNPPKKTLPDLVDEFGTPLLVWNEDETAGPIKFDGGTGGPTNFTRQDSGDPKKLAHFYWASNACFLKANSLGKLRTNQLRGNGGTFSLIGATASTASPETIDSLAGALGYPTAAVPTTITDIKTIIPTASRGKFMVQAADADGYYFASRSKGAGDIENNGGKPVIRFGNNFVLPDGKTIRTNDAGVPTSIDVIAKFEDTLVSSGS